MSLFEHSRQRVTTQLQHPLKHTLNDFIFAHPSLPSNIVNLDQALTWLFDAVYPQTQAAVANVAALPAAGNTVGDQRVVQDDGDGKAALYKWAQYDGQSAPSWHKIMDVDWSTDSILSDMINRTQPHFVLKKGSDDADETGAIIAGVLAGQVIFGGKSANTNLTLFANNGDATGRSGYVQLGDDTSPLVDNVLNLGESIRRFANVYSVLSHVGTMNIAGGSITDTSGAIDFDNENLSTTGTLHAGTTTIASDLVLGTGSIISASGALSFGSNNLTTTGFLHSLTGLIGTTLTLASGSITDTSGQINFGTTNLLGTGTLGIGFITSTKVTVDTLVLDNDTISSNAVNGSIKILATGSGTIQLQSPLTSGNQTVTGIVAVTGSLSVDTIGLDNDTISGTAGLVMNTGTGNLVITSALLPSVTATQDIGSSAKRFKDLYLSGSLNNGTNSFTMADLLSLRSSVYRDSARTQAVQAGDSLFWNGSQWLASAPDTEIIHKNITLDTATDDGHTQFAMLAGRAGGQTIKGGTLTGQTLSLRDNAVDGNGLDVGGTQILPTGNGTQDIGSTAKRIKDLYQAGELIGSRVQNLLESAITALTSASTKGRLFYSTDTKGVYVDTGGAKKRVGHNSYNNTLTHTTLNAGAVNVATGTEITDATNCIWQLRDSSTGELILAPMTVTSTTVTVSASPALPAGNYKLMGIEV